MNSVHFMSKKSDWETPQDLFNRLNDEFHFTLDAAASDLNHKLPHYYTEKEDGLAQDWGGGNGYFAILPMGARKQDYGQRNVGERRKSQTRLLFSLFPPELIVSLFMTSFTISPM